MDDANDLLDGYLNESGSSNLLMTNRQIIGQESYIHNKMDEDGDEDGMLQRSDSFYVDFENIDVLDSNSKNNVKSGATGLVLGTAQSLEEEDILLPSVEDTKLPINWQQQEVSRLN